MNTARLTAMLTNAVAFDLETHRFQPGLAIPPIVVGSIAEWQKDRIKGAILDREQVRAAFTALMGNEQATIVGANIAFDMLAMAVDFGKRGVDVMPQIFAAYEAGRVFDVLIAEALHHIATGMLGMDPRTKKKLADPITKKPGAYSLGTVTDLVHGRKGAKANDRFRQSYALLEDLPIAAWPPEATQYPIDDSVNTLDDALAQAGLIANTGIHDWVESTGAPRCSHCHAVMAPGVAATCVSTYQRTNIHDLATQCYTAFAMSLGAAWGLTPDPVAVARLKYAATKDYDEDVKPFVDAGIVRADGTENQNALATLVAKAYGSVDPCPTCAGTVIPAGRAKGEPAPGKTPSLATAGRTLVNCDDCDGTALLLTSSVPRAEKGGVSKGRDPLAESGNELLMSYAAFGEDRKIRTVYVPFLEEGIAEHLRLRDDELTPAGLEACLARIAGRALGEVIPITLKPNVLLETNRTSYRDKTQTMPREGGVRECFEARPGSCYFSNDYGGIELATWAQTCIWMGIGSELAKALNAGVNVHGALAATMCGENYDAFMKKVDAGDKLAKAFRQAAKPGNFMFPGGGGVARFVQTQRVQGPDTEHPTGPIIKNGKRIYRGLRFCLLIGGAQRCGEKLLHEYRNKPISPTCAKCIECAERIKEGWEKQWPEAKAYFKIINRISEQGWQKHPISNRIRGGIGYCDAANGYFQELAAQGAKDALRVVAREQYDHTFRPEDLGGDRSVLYGNARTIAFLHDELLGEALLPVAPECSERVGVVMVKRMKLYVPDVRVTAEPTLMPRWYKAAQCVRDENGRLMVWHPK